VLDNKTLLFRNQHSRGKNASNVLL
jgi:hypothetical protein